MQQQTRQTYEFGPFRLDPATRVLLKDGKQVQLTPKAFDTLLVLVEANGQLLKKDELMQRVWPDSFVEEGNLTVNISTLRKALGENRGAHRYIVTEPGRGYRFVADVRGTLNAGLELVVEERAKAHLVIEESQETETAVRLFPATGAAIRRLSLNLNWKVVTACAMLLILVPATAIWKFVIKARVPTYAGSLPSLQITPFASWKTETYGTATAARFSHDGKMIAFSSTKSGHSNLWIKQVMGGDQIQITRGDWTDLTPTWSPDGQQIAFLSNRGNQHGIWLSLSHGGTPTLLKTLDGESKFLSRWSKDGKTIYYELDHNFYALDIDSKRTSQLTNFDSSKAFSRNFSISIDENWITYADSKNGQFDIWMMPVGEGAPRQVTNDSYSDMYPTWHPDGTKIIYSSDRGASYQICIAYLDGREPKQITFTGGDSVTPDVSPDGARILFTTFKEESDLRGVRTDGGAEFEITSEVGLAVWPDASPDGKLIVFQAGGSERLPSGQILARAISTGDQEIPFASNGFDSRWSPDGSKVAFLRFLGDRFNLWTINATGGEPNQLTSDGLRPSSFRQLPLNRARDGGYRWSPDSSKLAYCSTSSDQRNIWTVSADGSIHTKISNNADPGKAFMHPLWSRAGARIASVLAPRSASVNESDSWSVWVSDLGSIFQHPYCLWLIGWSSSDNSLIVASTEDKNGFKLTDVALLQISLEGSSRSIAQLKLAYPDNIELSPDGKSVAYVSRQDGLDNVWMVSTGGGPAMKLTTNTDPRLYLSTLTWSPNGKAIYYGKQTRSSQVSVIENFK